jgi:hypothetical protein
MAANAHNHTRDRTSRSLTTVVDILISIHINTSSNLVLYAFKPNETLIMEIFAHTDPSIDSVPFLCVGTTDLGLANNAYGRISRHLRVRQKKKNVLFEVNLIQNMTTHRIH